MKMKKILLYSLIPFFLLLVSCAHTGSPQVDLINNTFPEAQAELREVVKSIVRDSETANVEGLHSIHLLSEKFTKFGPRRFDRQDVHSTNEEEAAHFTSVDNFKADVRELKIDVFGEVAIVTYYPHVSFVKDGNKMNGSARQTLVFLKTKDGWKIVHEHGTIRREDD
jgi:ketosteroid isomerase-like protein